MYQDTFKIKIDNEEYLIKYPNVGQQLEIETMKDLLSTGKYVDLAKSGSTTAGLLLDLIDAVSYFYVLVPELKAKIDIKNFANIDVKFQRKLGKAFIKYYNDFIVKTNEEINKELELEN